MKITLKILPALLTMAVLIGACGKTETTSPSTTTENEVINNTPLGQASVVDEVSDPNILQIAIGSKDHTTLVAAVQAAGIEHVLVNAGPLTVFAPVNSAFDALPAGTVDNLLKPENKADLTAILTGHAAPGTFNKTQLIKEAKKGRKVYTAAGSYLDVEIKDKDIYVGGAKVLAEVETSNGYIMVVDKVILP